MSAPRAKSPSLVKQIAQQSEEETIARARDEARVREQRTEALGLGPDTHPASAPEGDSPAEPLTFVEQVAWRAEQEAIDRGSDELRAQRRLAESLGLVPAPSTEDPKKQT